MIRINILHLNSFNYVKVKPGNTHRFFSTIIFLPIVFCRSFLPTEQQWRVCFYSCSPTRGCKTSDRSFAATVSVVFLPTARHSGIGNNLYTVEPRTHGVQFADDHVKYGSVTHFHIMVEEINMNYELYKYIF